MTILFDILPTRKEGDSYEVGSFAAARDTKNSSEFVAAMPPKLALRIDPSYSLPASIS